LKPRTRALYASLLRVHIQPTLGKLQLPAVTPVAIRKWYAGLDTGPTAKANAYGLLRTILAEAVDDGLLAANPARIKGAGSKRRARELRVLTVQELKVIVEDVPDRYRALILLGAWCALRFGELAALRRCDLDLKAGVVHVRHAVTVADGHRWGAQERRRPPCRHDPAPCRPDAA
jgi:integrase